MTLTSVIKQTFLISLCGTPHITDLPSTINTRERERQLECTNQRVGALFRLLGHTSAGRVVHCTVRSDVPEHWKFLRPQVAVPQALTLFRGVRLIAWSLRNPFLRGKADRKPGVFGGLPDASGLRPCDWNHLKNGIGPHTYACQLPVHQSTRHNHV